MRAREPDREGFVDRDGVRLHYEVFGDGEPTLVLVPSNPIVHSRQWKAQVPFLARHYRVVTFDGRGNGRSDRPVTPEAHTEEACVADLEAVLAATCPEPAVLIGLCSDGVWRSLWFAADHPERVAGIVALSVGVPLHRPTPPVQGREHVRPGARQRRRVGEAQPSLLAARLSRLRRVLLHRDVPRAALHQADRGLRRLGPGDQHRGDAGLHGRALRALQARRGGDLPADPVPAADRPRRRGPLPALRSGGAAGGADRSAAGHPAGRRPHAPALAIPSRSTC